MKIIKIALPHSIYRDFLIHSGICNITAHNLIIRLIEIETENKSHEEISRQLRRPDQEATHRRVEK